MTTLPLRPWLSGLALLIVAGCVDSTPPQNIEAASRGLAYQAQYRDLPARPLDPPVLRSEAMNAARCLPYAGDGGVRGDGKGASLDIASLRGERLSRNDLLDVRIDADETLSGSYVISRDGMLRLPFLDPIPAQGRSPEQVEEALTRALVAEGFYEFVPRLSVRMKDYASISVAVDGAVFEPRVSEIGGTPGDRIDTERQLALGASTEARNLSAAIRSAGGIRPDADLSAVELRRGGRLYRLDLRELFFGRDADADVMLLTGDEIRVPSRECFQDDLMRPGPLSPPGVSLYLSNLTQPAAGNAQSAIGRDVREVPYGTRMMQAVVDANCVGGARATSANRSAALFTRNPITGVSTVIERDIETMLRRPDRDDHDPYVLPGDALACYDSAVTNLAEVARVMGLVGVGLLLR